MKQLALMQQILLHSRIFVVSNSVSSKQCLPSSRNIYFALFAAGLNIRLKQSNATHFGNFAVNGYFAEF